MVMQRQFMWVSKGAEMVSGVFHKLKQSDLELDVILPGQKKYPGTSSRSPHLSRLGCFDLKGTVSLLLNYDEVDILLHLQHSRCMKSMLIHMKQVLISCKYSMASLL